MPHQRISVRWVHFSRRPGINSSIAFQKSDKRYAYLRSSEQHLGDFNDPLLYPFGLLSTIYHRPHCRINHQVQYATRAASLCSYCGWTVSLDTRELSFPSEFERDHGQKLLMETRRMLLAVDSSMILANAHLSPKSRILESYFLPVFLLDTSPAIIRRRSCLSVIASPQRIIATSRRRQ